MDKSISPKLSLPEIRRSWAGKSLSSLRSECSSDQSSSERHTSSVSPFLNCDLIMTNFALSFSDIRRFSWLTARNCLFEESSSHSALPSFSLVLIFFRMGFLKTVILLSPLVVSYNFDFGLKINVRACIRGILHDRNL